MKMRMAEMVARQPFDHLHVEPFLCWIAGQDRNLRAGRAGRRPFDPIRQRVGDGCRVEARRTGIFGSEGERAKRHKTHLAACEYRHDVLLDKAQ
jgi:hypothetical protein